MSTFLAFIEGHAAKVGFGGTFLALTLAQWSAVVSIGAGILTITCLVPVAITRWKKLFRGEDTDK